jgi:ubiquinone/menaquinone biosynthesis C-methylase UbiE
MALHVGSTPENNIKDNLETWSNYDWKDLGGEWSRNFGGSVGLWHGVLFPRIHRFLDCEHILEIAPGHGRCTQYLLPRCRRLTIVDLVPKCIEFCRQRFNDDPRINFVVNDGMSLPNTADQSVDFVFSWDSLVHVDRAPIRSYLFEIARVLKPGGFAFIHHSNLGMQYNELSPADKALPFGFRQPTMSAAAMATDCREAHLWCCAQELLPQARAGLLNDCITLIKNDPSKKDVAPIVKRREDWAAELATVAMLTQVYGTGSASPEASART